MSVEEKLFVTASWALATSICETLALYLSTQDGLLTTVWSFLKTHTMFKWGKGSSGRLRHKSLLEIGWKNLSPQPSVIKRAPKDSVYKN